MCGRLHKCRRSASAVKLSGVSVVRNAQQSGEGSMYVLSLPSSLNCSFFSASAFWLRYKSLSLANTMLVGTNIIFSMKNSSGLKKIQQYKNHFNDTVSDLSYWQSYERFCIHIVWPSPSHDQRLCSLFCRDKCCSDI